MEQRFLYKSYIDACLRERFEERHIRGEPFFINKNGVPFRVLTMDRDLLVTEYADTWEDGDLHEFAGRPKKEVLNEILQEVENAEPED